MNVSERAPVSEPLAELASFALDWAHCLCDPEAGCRDYHRGWSTVRHVEAGGALPAGVDFFGEALRRLARGGRIRVLLSGAADTGLAAMVLTSLRPHGIEPEIVLVDRCLTTLEQNRLYARHSGLQLQTFLMNAAELDVPPVDAVVVHSFLGFFAPAARQAVVDMWARNLSPHGEVLMSHRLSRTEGVVRPPVDPAELAQRKAGIAAKALAIGYSPARSAQMSGAAEELWKIRKSFPQLVEDELMSLLARSGLRPVSLIRDEGGDSFAPSIMPAHAKRGYRAELIAAHAE